MNEITVIRLGKTRFSDCWSLQQQLLDKRQRNETIDLLLLTEHFDVYTIGKGGDENHLLADSDELRLDNIEIFRIDRGGDITFHGPGQIVGYPIIDLNNFRIDLHWYLRSIEEVMITTLQKYGISANREEGLTGVWVNGEKIGAIGIKVSKWVTMHGFALNINTNLRRFERIIPCGIFNRNVTSMQKILGREVKMSKVEDDLIRSFSLIFEVNTCEIDKDLVLDRNSRSFVS
jgi:lipoate-protein ligase B